MAGEAGEIRSLLKQILGLESTFKDIVPCTVNSVSDNTCDCSPIDGTADLLEVRITSEVDATNVTFKPSIGSIVMVGLITDNDGVVVMYGKLDSINLHGDQYGGIAKIETLTTKLNNLENLVNDLVTKYNTHTHAGVTSGSSSTAIPSAIETTTLTPTERSDIENTNVQHG